MHMRVLSKASSSPISPLSVHTSRIPSRGRVTTKRQEGPGLRVGSSAAIKRPRGRAGAYHLECERSIIRAAAKGPSQCRGNIRPHRCRGQEHIFTSSTCSDDSPFKRCGATLQLGPNSDRVVLDTSICTVGRWRYVLQRELVPRGAAVCQLPHHVVGLGVVVEAGDNCARETPNQVCILANVLSVEDLVLTVREDERCGRSMDLTDLMMLWIVHACA